MRRRRIGWIALICAMAFPPIARGSDPASFPEEADMIVWERQNWETNGGFERLTLWSDGRSEVVVAPLGYSRDGQENLRPKDGWEKVRRNSPSRVEFVRRDVYPPDAARTKFWEALAAGIHLLEPFPPGFVDGGGTRVVVRTKDLQKEIVIPMFLDREKGTANHRRFLAVSDILDRFDRSAYDVVPR